MTARTALVYFNQGIEYLNNWLVQPTETIHTTLSLNTESLPSLFKTPVNFTTLLLLACFMIVGYANNLICNLLGILYPLMHGFNASSGDQPDNDLLATLNKYWMIFGILTLADTFFGMVLNLIPGYYYLRIGLIYLLVRDNFSFTNTAFTTVETFYVQYHVGSLLKELMVSFSGFVMTFMNMSLNTPETKNQ